jgi:protein-S-isoprenylcysteine O-methyltransferase Ste14
VKYFSDIINFMISVPQFVAVVWLIFVSYWFISALSVKSIQETRGWLGGNWYPILYLIGVLFIVNFKFLGRLGVPIGTLGIILYQHTAVQNAAVIILLIVGLIVAILARRTLAGNWSGQVAFKKDHELVTTGLYQYIRHPIYTGMLMMILGTALSQGTLGAVIGFLIILFGVLFKLRDEEVLMTEHFAEGYASYKKRTKMLIPFLW